VFVLLLVHLVLASNQIFKQLHLVATGAPDLLQLPLAIVLRDSRDVCQRAMSLDGTHDVLVRDAAKVLPSSMNHFKVPTVTRSDLLAPPAELLGSKKDKAKTKGGKISRTEELRCGCEKVTPRNGQDAKVIHAAPRLRQAPERRGWHQVTRRVDSHPESHAVRLRAEAAGGLARRWRLGGAV